MDKPGILSDGEVKAALESLTGWKSENGSLLVTYQMPGPTEAIGFFAAIGELSQALKHHPEVDWRYDKMIIRTTTHQVDGQITARDTELAGSIAANASRFHAEAV